MLVFGGATGKLRPDGPFLQLRHDFERKVLLTNTLIVIGYSFGDGHLNAIIRRWVATRRKARLVIVDPGAVNYSSDALGTPYKLDKQGKLERKTVDITHVKKISSSAIDDVINVVDSPIDLSIPSRVSGFIPQVLVNVVT